MTRQRLTSRKEKTTTRINKINRSKEACGPQNLTKSRLAELLTVAVIKVRSRQTSHLSKLLTTCLTSCCCKRIIFPTTRWCRSTRSVNSALVTWPTTHLCQTRLWVEIIRCPRSQKWARPESTTDSFHSAKIRWTRRWILRTRNSCSPESSSTARIQPASNVTANRSRASFYRKSNICHRPQIMPRRCSRHCCVHSFWTQRTRIAWRLVRSMISRTRMRVASSKPTGCPPSITRWTSAPLLLPVVRCPTVVNIKICWWRRIRRWVSTTTAQVLVFLPAASVPPRTWLARKQNNNSNPLLRPSMMRTASTNHLHLVVVEWPCPSTAASRRKSCSQSSTRSSVWSHSSHLRSLTLPVSRMTST